MDRYADSTRLVLHQGNSLDLSGPILMRLAEGPLRFVSIDGGHTADITAHDLATADAAIAEGGIIVVDDVFNEQWPGVGDGVRRYCEHASNVVPFAIGANETYFCRPDPPVSRAFLWMSIRLQGSVDVSTTSASSA